MANGFNPAPIPEITDLTGVYAEAKYCGGYKHQYWKLENVTLAKTYWEGIEVGDYYRYPACSWTPIVRNLIDYVPEEDYGILKLSATGSYGNYYYYLSYLKPAARSNYPILSSRNS